MTELSPKELGSDAVEIHVCPTCSYERRYGYMRRGHKVVLDLYSPCPMCGCCECKPFRRVYK